MRGALLTTTLFAIAAVALLGVRPLWLDEILQLIETRQPSTAEMIRHIPRNAGAAPLGYLVQRAALSITGYSLRKARLPAALFGIATVFAVAVLGAELGLRRPWVAAALFAVLPTTLRYSTESRVYSQALFFSVVATLTYVRMAKRGRWPLAAGYCLTLIAAVYTHPYSAAVGVAHILWSAIFRERRTALLGAASLAAAILAFRPWYLWSKGSWAATVEGSALHFSASAKTPLMLFRELGGAGYWGSAALLALCVLAVVRSRMDRRAMTLLLLLIVAPFFCVFAADALGDYFIASRQFIWVLPAIAILAAAEVERRTPCALALAALFSIACVWQNGRYFSERRENWDEAAAAISEETSRGACLAVAPPESARFYQFFRPELSRTFCEAPRMVLAITPYTTSGQRRSALTLLTAQGYRQEAERSTGGSTIIFFRR